MKKIILLILPILLLISVAIYAPVLKEKSDKVNRMKMWLRDERTLVRGGAAYQLYLMGEEEIALPIILELLNNDDPYTRLCAIESLEKLGRKDILSGKVWLIFATLTSTLNHESPQVRWRATEMIERMGMKNMSPAVMKLLTDNDAEVRWHVIKTLAHLGAKEAVPEIENRLTDENRLVRDFAKYALRKLAVQTIR